MIVQRAFRKHPFPKFPGSAALRRGLTGFHGSITVIFVRAISAGKKKVFVIIPVHNRREITLGCLACLRAAGDLDWANVVVVDDGSTDGTADAIREKFPEVILLKGDGNLWWTGGIVLGMKEAVRLKAEVIVWLNDDCHPRPGAMGALVSHTLQAGSISVGQTLSSAGAHYFALTKTAWGVRSVPCAAGTVVPCDTFPGNFVAIPRRVVDQVGYPDARTFPHVFADIDYGLRARRHGFEIMAVGDAQGDGVDTVNPRAASWLLDQKPAGQILASVMNRTGTLHPKTYWKFATRHWGVLGVIHWAQSYFRLAICLGVKSIVPRSWLLRWFGRHSVAWNIRVATEKNISAGVSHGAGDKLGGSL
ncbi:MAG: glycosyltransferase family 2 protein [Verrucomicrobiota bacterium]